MHGIENEIIARQLGGLMLENARLSARCNQLMMDNGALSAQLSKYQQADAASKEPGPETGNPIVPVVAAGTMSAGEAVSAGTAAPNYAVPENLQGTIYDKDQG